MDCCVGTLLVVTGLSLVVGRRMERAADGDDCIGDALGSLLTGLPAVKSQSPDRSP